MNDFYIKVMETLKRLNKPQGWNKCAVHVGLTAIQQLAARGQELLLHEALEI